MPVICSSQAQEEAQPARPTMSPWEAAAKYGTVEPAFTHLGAAAGESSTTGRDTGRVKSWTADQDAAAASQYRDFCTGWRRKSDATNSWPQFCQILIDLQKFFTGRFLGKFAVKWLLTAPLLRGLVHLLRLIAVRWPGTHSARDNHVFPCNFAKYLPILTFFHRQT